MRDSSFNVRISFYVKIVGSARQFKDAESKRRNEGLFTILVLLVFIANCLHMFIQEALLRTVPVPMTFIRPPVVQSQDRLCLYMYV